MSMHQRKTRIYGKEYIFTVKEPEARNPIYRQIRSIVREPPRYEKIHIIYLLCREIISLFFCRCNSLTNE